MADAFLLGDVVVAEGGIGGDGKEEREATKEQKISGESDISPRSSSILGLFFLALSFTKPR